MKAVGVSIYVMVLAVLLVEYFVEGRHAGSFGHSLLLMLFLMVGSGFLRLDRRLRNLEGGLGRKGREE